MGTGGRCLSSNSRAGENDGIAPHDDWKFWRLGRGGGACARFACRRAKHGRPGRRDRRTATVGRNDRPVPASRFQPPGNGYPARRPASDDSGPACRHCDGAAAQRRSGPGRGRRAMRTAHPVSRPRHSAGPGAAIRGSSPCRRASAGGEPPLTPSLPLEVTTDPAPQPVYRMTRSCRDAGGILGRRLTVLALDCGADRHCRRRRVYGWSRRGRSRRHGDPGRMAFAGLAPDAGPRPSPVPPAAPAARSRAARFAPRRTAAGSGAAAGTAQPVTRAEASQAMGRLSRPS